MPVDEWEGLREAYQQYETLLAAYGVADGYSVRVTDNSIEFVYGYLGGWDYEFYSYWNDQLLEVINAQQDEIGYRWNIVAVGEISQDTNPWQDVGWLSDVEVYHGVYLNSDSLGWFYADDWSPEGQFWAYSWEQAFQGWMYVFGDGYYYNYQTSEWLLNLVDTGWFFVFESDGQGGSTGSGQWLDLISTSDPRMEGIDEIVQSEMILQNLPGLAVGVFENGQFVHMAGYGVTDLDDPDSQVTTSTIFRWASISKPLTAVAAFQLVEDSSIDFSITDPVPKHVPHWKPTVLNPDPFAGLVTVAHLLQNRSGIHHYGNGLDDDDTEFSYDSSLYDEDPDGYDAFSAVQVFNQSGLAFTPPGTNYLYSTFGFNLLGSAIDYASPNGLVAWTLDNIADPLGMSSLAVSTGTRSGFKRDCDGALVQHPIGSQEWKLPGGGWESNIVDLTKFARGIAEGTLLNNTNRLWGFVPDLPGTDDDDYRFGINQRGSGDSLRVWHGGSHDNLKTLMITYPNIDYGVAIMIPVDHGDTWRIANRIRGSMGIANFNVDLDPVDLCNLSEEYSEDCGYRYSAVWRKSGDDVILRRGLRRSAFFREWEFMRENGYYCDDFEPSVEGNEVLWSGTFKKGAGSNAITLGKGWDDLLQFAADRKAAGMVPVDFEAYYVNGALSYAALFRPGSGDYEFVQGLNQADFATRRTELDGQGFEVIDIESYLRINGAQIWGGLFVTRPDNTSLYRNYTTTDFWNLYSDLKRDGWRTLDLEAYETSDGLRWAGTWEKVTDDEIFFTNQDYCGIISEHRVARRYGYKLVDLIRYLPD